MRPLLFLSRARRTCARRCLRCLSGRTRAELGLDLLGRGCGDGNSARLRARRVGAFSSVSPGVERVLREAVERRRRCRRTVSAARRRALPRQCLEPLKSARLPTSESTGDCWRTGSAAPDSASSAAAPAAAAPRVHARPRTPSPRSSRATFGAAASAPSRPPGAQRSIIALAGRPAWLTISVRPGNRAPARASPCATTAPATRTAARRARRRVASRHRSQRIEPGTAQALRYALAPRTAACA